MAIFQPPPSYADPVIIDEQTKRARFNPIWLKWFLDLTQVLNEAGGGSIVHNDTAGLQGGQTNQMYHMTASEYSYAQGLIAGTVAVSCTSMTSSGAVSGTTVTGSGLVKGAGVESTAALTISDTKILKTNTNFANGAAAAAGTLANAPAAGNPTKWIPIDDNGTTRYIPAW